MGEQRARGVITAVQEGRFFLRTTQGATRLFILSASAPVEPQDLPPLQRAQVPVEVRYCDSGKVIAAVAHDVLAPSDPASRRGTPMPQDSREQRR